MSEVLEINGEHFVPVSFAATQVGYTSDYIARLAREKKVTASKVGRQWFVSLKSLNAFVLEAAKEKDRRSEVLSLERKTEKYQSAKISPKKEKPKTGVLVAAMQTLMILVLGVSVGIGGYFFGTGQTGVLRAYSGDTIALSVYEFFSAQKKSEGVQMAAVVLEEDHVLQTHDLQNVLNEEIFSDDVTLTRAGADEEIAVVTPKFKGGLGEAQRFFLVPVSKNGEVKVEFENFVAGDFRSESNEFGDNEENN